MQNKTKKELFDELRRLKRRIFELEKLETRYRETEKLLIASEERYRTIADFAYDWEYWVAWMENIPTFRRPANASQAMVPASSKKIRVS